MTCPSCEKLKEEIDGLKWRLEKRLVDKATFDELQASRSREAKLVEALENGLQCTCIGEGSMGYSSCPLHQILAAHRKETSTNSSSD